MDKWDVVYIPWEVYLNNLTYTEEDKVLDRVLAEDVVQAAEKISGRVIEVKLVEVEVA